MGRPTRKDDDEVGVPSTTTMIMMAAATTMVGVPPRCPMGLRTSLRPPLKGMRQNLAPRGLQHPPHQDRDRLGARGVGTPTSGSDDHCNPDGEKVKEGIEGGEDGRCDFEQVLYTAQIAPPMLPRG
jgi:hypothetical protein